jgi:hypothetical protein
MEEHSSYTSGYSRFFSGIVRCAQARRCATWSDSDPPSQWRAYCGLGRRVAQTINSKASLGPTYSEDVYSEATLKLDTILDAGLQYGIMTTIMDTARKITVEVPLALLEKAQQASGTGVTQTVRTGLQLVAASRTYARLRKLRGKVRFSRTVAELKADR